LEWSGDPREEFYVGDFKLPDHIESDLIGKNLPSFLAKPVNALLRPKVTFHHDICVGCGACAANCPAKVITMKDHRPYADYSSCIRCYCCQELCPKNAVSVRESRLFKLVRRW
ncbi:MAG: 4Fe-4S binding protein, partial [Clostridia bacterium]